MSNGRTTKFYFAWDRGQEAKQDLADFNDRYPALFELRRQEWPALEVLASEPDQSIGGFIDRLILGDFQPACGVIGEQTGIDPQIIERVDKAGRETPLDAAVFDEADLVIIVSLDHDQKPDADELAAAAAFLKRSDARLVVSLHHSLGLSDDPILQEIERRHHGDLLTPPRDDIGGFGRALLAGLGLPVVNRYGLAPAAVGDGAPATLVKATDLPSADILEGVETFNLHPHLPHFQIQPAAARQIDVLAKQYFRTASDQPHPFQLSAEGRSGLFNAFLRARGDAARSGEVLICDATLWSPSFGGEASLKRLWRNLAQR